MDKITPWKWNQPPYFSTSNNKETNMKQTPSAWLTCLTVPLPKRHQANRVSRWKWESPVQIVKHPPGCLWYGNAWLCACMCMCVSVCFGRGSSNKSAGFVASTVAALFERGPGSVPSASCNRNSSSSLLSTQLVFAKNLFSSTVWMCVHVCVRWIKRVMLFFPLYSRKEWS